MASFADPLDAAEHQQRQVMQMRIDAIRNQPRELNPKGVCHWCEEPVINGHLFCDADCSHDYQRSKRK